jgi:hypothetical protein
MLRTKQNPGSVAAGDAVKIKPSKKSAAQYIFSQRTFWRQFLELGKTAFSLGTTPVNPALYDVQKPPSMDRMNSLLWRTSHHGRKTVLMRFNCGIWVLSKRRTLSSERIVSHSELQNEEAPSFAAGASKGSIA